MKEKSDDKEKRGVKTAHGRIESNSVLLLENLGTNRDTGRSDKADRDDHNEVKSYRIDSAKG